MKKYLLPFLLIISGVCLTVLSVRRKTENKPLMEISGSLAGHDFIAGKRSFSKTDYFWLRGYACTFTIPLLERGEFDRSLFDRSFQDTTTFYVKVFSERKNDLQVNGRLVPVHGIRTDSQVYLEESEHLSLRFKPGLLFAGILLVLSALILLIIYLVKEIRSY